MKRFIGGRLTTLAMLICLEPLLAGCWTTQQMPLSQYPPLNQATGLTTRSGGSVPFGPRGARVVHDTLYATGREGPVVFPTDSVERVSIRKFSWGRAIGLYLGAATVALAVLVTALCSPYRVSCH